MTRYVLLYLLTWMSAILFFSVVNGKSTPYKCKPNIDTISNPVDFKSKIKGNTSHGDMPLTITDDIVITNLAKELIFTNINGEDRLTIGNSRFRPFSNYGKPEMVNGQKVSNGKGGVNCYRLFPDVGQNSNIQYYEYGNDLLHLYPDKNAMNTAISLKKYDAQHSWNNKITPEELLKGEQGNRVVLRVDTNTGEVKNIISSMNHYEPPYLRVNIQSKKDLIDIQSTGISTKIQNTVLDTIKSTDGKEKQQWKKKNDFYGARMWAENPKNIRNRQYNIDNKKYDLLYEVTLKSNKRAIGTDAYKLVGNIVSSHTDYVNKKVEIQNERSKINCRNKNKRKKRNAISFKQDKTLTSSCLRIVKRMSKLKRTFRQNKMDLSTLRNIGEDVNEKMTKGMDSTKKSKKLRIASKLEKIDSVLGSVIGVFKDVEEIAGNERNNNGQVAIGVVKIMGQLADIGGAFMPPPIGIALSIGSQIIGAVFGMDNGPSIPEVMGNLIDKQTKVITDLFGKQTEIITKQFGEIKKQINEVFELLKQHNIHLFDKLIKNNEAIFRNTTISEAAGAMLVLETTHGFLVEMWKNKYKLSSLEICPLTSQIDIKTGVYHIGKLKRYIDVYCTYENMSEYFVICLNYLSLYIKLSSMRMVQLSMLTDIYAAQKDFSSVTASFRETHKDAIKADLSILRKFQGIDSIEQRCWRHYLARHKNEHSFIISYMNYLGIPFHMDNVVFIEAQDSTKVLHVYEEGGSYYLTLKMRTRAKGQQWLSDGSVILSNNEYPEFELHLEDEHDLDNKNSILWSKLSTSHEDSVIMDNGTNLESGMLWGISKYNDLTTYKSLQCRESSFIVAITFLSKHSMELVSPREKCQDLGRKKMEISVDFIRLIYQNLYSSEYTDYLESLCAGDIYYISIPNKVLYNIPVSPKDISLRHCTRTAETLMPFAKQMRNSRKEFPIDIAPTNFAYMVTTKEKQLTITGTMDIPLDPHAGKKYSILTKKAGVQTFPKIFQYPKASKGKELSYGPCLATFEDKIFSVDPSSNIPFMHNMHSNTSEVTVLPRIIEPSWNISRCAAGIWNDYPVMLMVEHMKFPSSSVTGPRILYFYMTHNKSTRWQFMPATLPVKADESFIGMSYGLITLINGVDIQYFDEISNQWKQSLHNLISPANAIVHVTNVGWGGVSGWTC